MDRSECVELGFITRVDNLASILEFGILSYNVAVTVDHQSVANEEVQGLRAAVVIPPGLNLHDYANLYINARNPMMYFLRNHHTELVVLRVDASVLELPDVVLSDMNAARNMVRFGPPDEMLPRLDRNRIFARYWNHDDPMESYRHKGEMCAEVLVPGSVPPDYITGIYVSCKSTEHSVSQVCDTVPIVIDAYRFFQGEPG